MQDNRSFQPIHHCRLARKELNQLLPKALRSEWAEDNVYRATHAKAPRHTFRPSPRNARQTPLPLTLRLSSDGKCTFFFGKAPGKLPWLHERLNDTEYLVPAGSFWQVHPEVASQLVQTIAEWAEAEGDGMTSLVDAYSGVGTFARAIRGNFVERLLIESDPEATKAAEYNLQQAGLAFQIATAPTEKALPKRLRHFPLDKTLLLLDPPRTGCAPEVLQAIRKTPPARIAYISCNPATLARDLKQLCGQDGCYTLERLAIFDMFPRTAHFESAVWLRKQGS
jgi:hypothetical protein